MSERVILYMDDCDYNIYRPFGDFERMEVNDSCGLLVVKMKLKNDIEPIKVYSSIQYERKDYKVIEEQRFEYHRDLVFEFLYEAFAEDRIINLAIMHETIEDNINQYKG